MKKKATEKEKESGSKDFNENSFNMGKKAGYNLAASEFRASVALDMGTGTLSAEYALEWLDGREYRTIENGVNEGT